MMPKRNVFDQLDYKIILELRNNARVSASVIARNLGANERTVRKRIDRLVKGGAIRLTSIVNPQAFDYVTSVDIFLETDLNLEKEIVEQLLSMQEISYVAYGQGNRDISIEARFKNNDDMREFLRHTLASIPGVKVTGYTLVPRILRNIDDWLPKSDDFSEYTQESDDF